MVGADVACGGAVVHRGQSGLPCTKPQEGAVVGEDVCPVAWQQDVCLAAGWHHGAGCPQLHRARAVRSFWHLVRRYRERCWGVGAMAHVLTFPLFGSVAGSWQVLCARLEGWHACDRVIDALVTQHLCVHACTDRMDARHTISPAELIVPLCKCLAQVAVARGGKDQGEGCCCMNHTYCYKGYG